jgi:hypothetical protein
MKPKGCTEFQRLKRIRDNLQREAAEARFKNEKSNPREKTKDIAERDNKVREAETLLDRHLAQCADCKQLIKPRTGG